MAEQPTVLTENDDDDKQEYVVVESPPEETPPAEEPAPAKNDPDDDDDDEPLKAGETEEDREAIRERRRLEKKERKERREKAIGRDKTELNFLRQQNDELERRLKAIESFTQKSTVNDIDRQINAAIQEAETAERIIAKAVEAGNGEDVTKALKFRDQAISKAQQLYNQKQAAENSSQPPAAPQIDTAIVHYAKEFMKENDWYDPSGRDEDSAIVMAIDTKLSEEGYDPRTEEYWDELRERVKRRIPEKFAVAPKQETRKPSGGPPVGSGREHAPASTRKEIYISPERKAAMQELGVWDDPVLRQRYVKRYAEYDRLNSEK